MVRIEGKRIIITSNCDNLTYEDLLMRQRSMLRLIQCAKQDMINEETIFFALEILDDMLMEDMVVS